MKNTLLLLFALCVGFCCPLHASVDVKSTFFTINEGLADNLVRHIYQDSKGFMWMSTLNGLSRYDGYSFITFRPEKGEHVSLANRHVLKVSEDKNGFLWIKTTVDIYSCYDLKHNRFVDFTGNGEYKENYNNLLEASNGDIWLWHPQNGCRKIITRNDRFHSVVFKKENGKLPHNGIVKILEDANGTVWICTQDGIVKVNGEQTELLARGKHILSAFLYEDYLFYLTPDGKIYQQHQRKEESQFLIDIANGNKPIDITNYYSFREDWIIHVDNQKFIFHFPTQKLRLNPVYDLPNARRQNDQAGNLWLHNKGWLRFIDVRTGEAKDFHFETTENFRINSFQVLQDSRGLLWIALYNSGLYVYDPASDNTSHFAYQAEGPSRVNSNNQAFIMEDRSGSIWMSSESAGISRLSILNSGVTRLFPEDNKFVDSSNSIRALSLTSKGTFLIGNRKGQLYTYDMSLQKKLRTENFPTSLFKIVESADRKRWAGSNWDGLYIEDRLYQPQSSDSMSLSFGKVFDFFCDYQGRMWVATFGGGLNLAIPNKDGSYRFRHFLQGNLSQQEIRVITGDKNNWMWVGTDDGLCVFHPDSIIENPNDYYRYTYENDYLPASEVKAIVYDSQERIWLGTMGGGISMCNPGKDYANLQFTHYSTTDGLINNMVQYIIEDSEKKLWITTKYGISRFTPDTKQFENFLFDSSTLGNVYNESSALLHPDGRLLFGAEHGLVIIDPNKIKIDNSIPDVTLTDLKINGVSISPSDENSPLKRALTYTEALSLSHLQNSFVVEFSTLDYHTLNGTRYTYLLEGFDKEWSIPSPLNFAAYKNLSPDNYTLRLKACNAVGTWSNKESILQIRITPPFWKTGWAYSVYLLLAMIAAYIAFRTVQKFNTLRNRISVENQLTEYKLVFFTNISHEFRTPLTLIQGALEKIENVGKLPKELAYSIRVMERNTQRMLRLINQLLEFRKMQNNKLSLSLEESDVFAFLHDIYDSFMETAERKKMVFRFVSSTDSYRMPIDKGKLDKVVYNLLSNAFKYTPQEGKVTLSVIVDKSTNYLKIAVTDNGVGIPKEKQGELFSRFMQSSFSSDSMGIGLHLTQELVKVHKGTIVFNENDGGGSIFSVSLPLDSSVYEETDFLVPNILWADDLSQENENVDVISDEDEPGGTTIPLNKKRILIIEDDTDVRDFLENELGTYFEVISEPDGISGLERARTCNADLIVCDVLMPGLTGYEVTRKLKDDLSTSHIPIILLTAMSTPENQLEGIERGADAYVTKPFSPKFLKARIIQLIRQRDKLREKYSMEPGISSQPLVSSGRDKLFLDKLREVMEKNISNPDFNANDFAGYMNMGRTSFFQKVKGITGYSPNEYIRVLRMKKAAELLLEEQYNVSEVSYAVGFNETAYFSKCFKEHFGIPPSAYKGKNSL